MSHGSGTSAGHDIKPKWRLQELRIDDADIGNFEVGQEIKADIFKEGEYIDVTGVSKGKGFQGVMKRHNMKGAKQKTHGTHEQFRHVGSIGCRTTPGEVHKGKRLPGRMGGDQVTTMNLDVVKVDAERNVVMVRGAIPGPKGAVVVMREAVKSNG